MRLQQRHTFVHPEDHDRGHRIDAASEQRVDEAPHLLAYCAPIVIGALLVAAASSVPRQYLAFDMGEAALGIYASVAAPVAVVQNGASYVYYPLIGYFADYYAERNYKKLI